MNLIFAFVFSFYICLSSCRSVKNVEDDPIKDILDKQASTSEIDNQKSLLNKFKFLKVLPLNKEWKNSVDTHGHAIKPETKNKNSVPIAIIIATPDGILDKVKNSELKTTTSEDEEHMAIVEEPNDISNINVDDVKTDVESKLQNENNFELPFNNLEEQIEQVLLHMDTETNTSKNDTLSDNELISTKSQIEDETDIETQIENVTIQDNDTETRRVIPDISEADIGSEETLHHKHSMLEINNDPKGTIVFNSEHCKQSGSSNESDIYIKDDNLKTFQISYVLNKYVYFK